MRRSSVWSTSKTVQRLRSWSGRAWPQNWSRSSSMAKGNVSHLQLLDSVVEAMGGQQRSGQHEMVRQVEEAIDSGTHLLVQAGTGTGKSLAYLLPLIAHA